MITKISIKDKHTLLKYAPLFWEEIEGEELAGKLCLESFANFLEVNLRNETLVGWFYEENKKIQGGILFSIVSDIFTNKLLLKEIFWFVLPDERNSWAAYKLIKQAEDLKHPSIEILINKYYNSSINKEFTCSCGKIWANKRSLGSHQKTCEKFKNKLIST